MKHVMSTGRPLWFGGVHVKKRYVSYHLDVASLDNE